ncbi:Nodulin-related protein 2 [Linum grandiflorum]
MDGLLSSITKAAGGSKEEHPPATTPAPTPSDHKKEEGSAAAAPSNAELMASAKVVAAAAQSAMQSKSADGIDKAKVADAAEDLIEAGNKYGKLDEKGYGQYVDKAENYLRQYSGGTKTTDGKSPADVPAEGAGKPAEEGAGKEEKSGGIGGYAKMAEGFFK